MKIAFYTTTFSPYVCGVSTAVLNLSLGLSKKGHQVILCIPKAKSPVFEKLKKQGIKIVFLPSFKTKLYEGINVGTPSAQSFLQIKKINPDIIHFHTPDLVGVEGILTAKILKKPLVGTFHTYFMAPEFQRIFRLKEKGSDFIEKILWKYNNSIYNRCDLIITPSEVSKKDLKQHGLKKPIAVVHNSIDMDSLQRPPKEQIAKLKKEFRLGQKTVLYVGRLSREKSLDLLILAFNLVVRKLAPAKLLLVGDGPALNELKELRRALGLEKEVIFTGKIEHQQLLKKGIYDLADLFATASTFEVQPMSVLEAMAFGLPIVGVKARGMPELIKGNGLICQPGDIKGISQAIVTILKEKSLREEFSRQSKKMIRQRYASKQVTNKMGKIYQGLIT